MQSGHHQVLAAATIPLLVAASGCLNLGGKTTYVTETVQTTERLTSLEARVASLETAVHGQPLTATAPPIGPEVVQPGVVYSQGPAPTQ